jgi:hypothetical protein
VGDFDDKTDVSRYERKVSLLVRHGHFMQVFSGLLLFKVYLGRDHGNISQPVQTCIVEGGFIHYVRRKIFEETMN